MNWEMSFRCTKKRVYALLVLLRFHLIALPVEAQHLVYAKGLSNTAGEFSSFNIKSDKFGNTFIAGYFAGTVDFDPGIGTAILTSRGQNDAFFAKYDGAGNYIYAKAIGGLSDENSYIISLVGVGNIYI